MKTIAIFPNELKPDTIKIALEICQFLHVKGVRVVTEDHQSVFAHSTPLSQIDPKQIDYILSLGGDGTILRLLHRHPHLKAPLLGINLGSLGFLADIPLDEIYQSLEELLAEKYTIQERMMMEGFTAQGENCFAVNEVVIHRAQNRCLVDLAIYVDDQYLNTFSADGMIISTPSGSTAYSLSAGGPILTPELNAFVLTPICAHTISNRPIVLMPKNTIQVEYLNPLLPVEICYDGISSFNLPPHELFTICLSKQRFSLITLSKYNYYFTLRKKLGWQGRLKTTSTN